MKKQPPLVIDGQKLSGVEELRLAVSNLDHTHEAFMDAFTAAELLQINRMLIKSRWEIFPDQWTKRQIREALAGAPPDWTDDGKPIYSRRAT